MIDLDKHYLAAITEILKRHVADCEVRAFGSRVSGGAERYSDLDLVVVGKERLNWRRLDALKDAFAQSDLPIMVDVLDWHAASEEFRKIIEPQSEVVWRPPAETSGGEHGRRQEEDDS